ncbi:hypothetical protein B2H97_16145 [Paraclostridium bifermentans]|uniref:hypothetical protein n=1 Tax=Paraclostridium bifermentans TaxID=1490 RepID=UPI000A171A9A|nr:hypothetical protein [Paraclostridium bifermentans]OSB07999.1 hypothetical protein B2H97_16145 [Paraclostridium bifermentans]
MRNITEYLSKATSVPRKLWEFEDLMKDTGGYKHKSLEETEDEHKKRFYKKNKRISRRFKKENK